MSTCTDIVRSVYDNQGELIQNLVKLHCGGSVDADVTYGAGGLWKGLVEPQLKFDLSLRPEIFKPTLKFDILPRGRQVIAGDVRNLPLRDKSLKSVMFDPPFIAGAIGHKTESIIEKNQYGSYKNSREMNIFFTDAVIEINRILKTYGILIFKCQDFTNGRKNHFAHIYVHDIAIKAGFKPIDLFILVAKSRPIQPNLKTQNHARKFHCYFWVFKKVRALIVGQQGIPHWWTAEDSDACKTHVKLEKMGDAVTMETVQLNGDMVLLPNEKEWEAYLKYADETMVLFTCRRCRFWLSMDGGRGACDGPELKCGFTQGSNCCEQWTSMLERNHGDME